MRVFWGFRLGEGRRRSASARTPSRCAHRDGRWATSIASIPNVFHRIARSMTIGAVSTRRTGRGDCR